MKNVHLNERILDELNRHDMADTNTYRYLVFRSYAGIASVKRIRREYLGTTACLYDASDENPNGWETVVLKNA